MAAVDPASLQPYVEDYDSVISEVIPMTRRLPTTRKSGLSQELSASSEPTSYDGVSDSGYSSTNTPNNETPPLKSTTPAPQNTRKDAMKRASTPGTTGQNIPRPPSKTTNNRTTSPAVPRNIPNAKPRERSPTMASSGGGADECDCADCKLPSNAIPGSSPHYSSSYNQNHSSSSYGHSPNYGNYQPYPDPRYDTTYPLDTSYPEKPLPTDRERKRTSLPAQRPTSSFSNSYTNSYPTYFSSSPAAAPAPSNTCPPTAFSPYAPPPLDTRVPPASGYSYSSYPYDTYDTYTYPDPHPQYPYEPTQHTYETHHSSNSSLPPPPQLHGPRRGSLGGRYHEEDYDYPLSPVLQPPTRRSSSRAIPIPATNTASMGLERERERERPSSWIQQQQQQQPAYLDTNQSLDRTVSASVPPGNAYDPPVEKRRSKTPGLGRERSRRESGGAREREREREYYGSVRLGPSALSRAMENCAISDEPRERERERERGHVRGSSDGYYGYATTGYDDRVEYTNPRAEEIQRPKLRMGRDVEYVKSDAYRYVRERQQQVHQQLHYGSVGREELVGRKSLQGEYAYAPRRRMTMSGGGI
ncbi:hypothetical protein BZA77DRAFT_50212 [Pyronema omphalodes]|nr:hypothetical protein BZA77DRAFT_50212 [Pyronema omphalodes]